MAIDALAVRCLVNELNLCFTVSKAILEKNTAPGIEPVAVFAVVSQRRTKKHLKRSV